ncbi:hypothetical protein GOP47_0019934 [Adiantum capillus-veneris]|uniref:Uncharacterized protein n=1 Tax=Adiantum capillus-veneris TaxID=13818 RepID=A0A9D4UC04_ADICA|nr:hypothetical protein GOP47_0019934 [Adiantum capillus-veneris]
MAVLAIPHSLYRGATLLLHRNHFGHSRNPFVFLSLNKDRRPCRTPGLQLSALLNPQDDPIVKEALKEPLAFLGGVFAGVFRLDLNEDPLREWVARTSEAAGVQDVEDVEVKDETPEEITIE